MTAVSLAHRVVTRFLARQAEEKTVWVVLDWDNRTEYIRDICFPLTAGEFEACSWPEGVASFSTEALALADLERRMKPVDKMQGQHGYYRHMHSDGRIIYVDSPAYR